MAIAGSGSFLKGLTGSAVNLNFRGFRDETVVSGKRKKGQSNPSPEFIQEQSIVRQLSAIYRLIKADIQLGITNKNGNQSRYNKWSSLNNTGAFNISAPPTATFIPANFKISSGVMTPALTLTAVADVSADDISVGWDGTSYDPTQLATDIPIVVLHNRTLDVWLQMPTSPQTRSSGIAQYNIISSGFAVLGNTIDVYFSMYGAPGTETAGTSQVTGYVTTTVVA